MIYALKLIIWWSLGAWAWYSIYRDFKTKPKFRKFVYLISAIFVPLVAYIITTAWATM